VFRKLINANIEFQPRNEKRDNRYQKLWFRVSVCRIQFHLWKDQSCGHLPNASIHPPCTLSSQLSTWCKRDSETKKIIQQISWWVLSQAEPKIETKHNVHESQHYREWLRYEFELQLQRQSLVQYTRWVQSLLISQSINHIFPTSWKFKEKIHRFLLWQLDRLLLKDQ
jgi:hypothetical protein